MASFELWLLLIGTVDLIRSILKFLTENRVLVGLMLSAAEMQTPIPPPRLVRHCTPEWCVRVTKSQVTNALIFFIFYAIFAKSRSILTREIEL